MRWAREGEGGCERTIIRKQHHPPNTENRNKYPRKPASHGPPDEREGKIRRRGETKTTSCCTWRLLPHLRNDKKLPEPEGIRRISRRERVRSSEREGSDRSDSAEDERRRAELDGCEGTVRVAKDARVRGTDSLRGVGGLRSRRCGSGRGGRSGGVNDEPTRRARNQDWSSPYTDVR